MKLILYFIILNCFAASETESHFSIGDKKIVIYNYKDQRISISEKCDSLAKEKFCTNINFLKDLNKKIKNAKLQHVGGTNPGSTICTEVLKGIVVVGVDSRNNENSFCRLPSGIYVDSGTLTYYSKQ